MRTIIAGLVALMAGGCATSESLEQRAREHDARADRFASVRDYAAADREQRKAQDLRRRATERPYDRPPTVTPREAPPAGPLLPPPLDPTIP